MAEGRRLPPQRGRFRGNGRPMNSEHRKPVTWGYKRLENLVEKDPSEILLTLSLKQNNFIEFLNSKTIRKDLLVFVLKALDKVCSSEHRAKLSAFLTTINSETQFLKTHVTEYLAKMTIEKYNDIHIHSLLHLVNYLKYMHHSLLYSSYDSVSVVLAVLKSTLMHLKRTECVLPNSLLEGVEELEMQVKDFIEKQQSAQAETSSSKRDLNVEKPPNNFRDIPIFPQAEDIVVESKPFLRPNIIKGKYADVDHYLDVQFRLLREDYIQPLREGIMEYRRRLEMGEQQVTKVKDLRTYTDIHVVRSAITDSGMIHIITFDVNKLKYVKWTSSKRLLYGSLLCLSSDGFETMLFATVTKREVEDLKKGLLQIQFQSPNQEAINVNPITAYTMVESSAYFESYRHNLLVLQGINEDTFTMREYIVEMNKDVKAPQYLRSRLKYDYFDLNFGSKIEYDLRTIGVENKVLRNIEVLNDSAWPSADELKLDDSQYKALKAALTKELSIIQGPPGTGKTYIGLRIVEILLNNSQYWDGENYPILLVCYTNHALDQFVEGVSKFTESIVRIGGRCKLESVNRFSLANIRKAKKENREVPYHIQCSLAESWYEMKGIQREINNYENAIDMSLKVILPFKVLKKYMCGIHSNNFVDYLGVDEDANMEIWLSIGFRSQNRQPNIPEENAAHLNVENNPPVLEENREPELEDEEEDAEVDVEYVEDLRIMEGEEAQEFEPAEVDLVWNRDYDEEYELDQVDDDGWMMQGGRKRLKKFIKQQLKIGDKMTEEEVQIVRNIWELNWYDRWRLYRYWVEKHVETLQENLVRVRNKFIEEAKKYEELLIERNCSIIRGMKVIAMTTTGAAKSRRLMEIVKPRIVIVEEAAEVLEAHIVTSLTQNTQHLVLIGDHQQLRPSPTVFYLAKKYNLEISLFERMIKNEVNFSQLELQHRMRPIISSLLVPAIYPALRDHKHVSSYPHVKGFTKDMFFVNHDVTEKHDDDSRSYANEHEANFIVELCRYILLQGYDASQITILTMYSGQLFAIKRIMKKYTLCKDVRVSVVDNYQGEENDIILLSFVRSNLEGSVGFLKTENRVCVALSRAKMGMYAIGNFDLLSEQSNLWTKIVMDLNEQSSIDNSIPIVCQNHPEKVRSIACSKDLATLAPEGGCNEPCEFRLPCGHVCPLSCHSYNQNHMEFRCYKKCGKASCLLEHPCKSICHADDPCPPCKATVEKSRSCGHTFPMPCHANPDTIGCIFPCLLVLPCGHSCKSQCSSPCTKSCFEQIECESPCGHKVKVECCDSENASKLLQACREMCSTVLSCSHMCKGTCGSCFQGSLHVPCKEACNRTLVCGHVCKAPCANDCPPCTRPCENRCVHSRCPNNCGEPCSPCSEKCIWKCEHYQCTKLCSEICNRPPCDKPCSRKRRCGHECIGMCGEPCPRKCRICHKDEVTEIFFGTEDEKDARFLQLEDCKHIFEVESLTRWMENNENNNEIIQMKACPKCKTPIRKNVRFGNTIRKCLEAVEKVKRKFYGNVKENNKKRTLLKTKLVNTMDKTFMFLCGWRLEDIRALLEILENILSTKGFIGMPKLILVENYLNFAERLLKIGESLFGWQRGAISLSAEYKFVVDRYGVIVSYLKKYCDRVSQDQLLSVSDELSKLELVTKALSWYSKYFDVVNCKQEAKDKYQLAIKCVMKFGPLQTGDKTSFKNYLDEARRLAGSAVLGITVEEKEQILKTMGLSRGHWYQCPNGHVYCITECGGAMEESTCNECGARIGGGSHRLRSDNQVATDMDGATRSAYPYGAGLEGN